ncbi:MAG: hypothetical protein ACPGLY_27180 [Rubripirellula sp.]
MKTRCHCIFCPKHPKHGEKLKYPTAWDPLKWILGNERESGAEVDCLEPASEAFWEFDIEPDGHEFPVTAYGDGCSMTGFHKDGITLYATCKNEEYKEK